MSSVVKTSEESNETKWSWVVLAAAFFNTLVINGQFTAQTIYYVIFLREFGESKAYTAWIPAAFNTAICIAGPIGSLLVPQLGPRFLIICSVVMYSLSYVFISMATSIPYLIILFSVNGISNSLIQTGHLATISAYFPRRFYLAMGIMYAGVGVGTLVIGLEVEWAVAEFGWRGGMLIQGGVILQACVGASLIFPTKHSTETSSSDHKAVINPFTLMKDVRFWILVLSLLSMYFTLTIINSMIKNVVISYGLESHFWLCLIMMGLGQMIGRVAAGFIAQHFLSAPLYYVLVSCGSSLLCVSLIFARSSWAIVVAILGFGLFQGQQIVVVFLKMAWVFGLQQLAIVRGYIFPFSIIASFVGAPLAGWTVDLTNSYDIALIISAISCSVSGVCGILIYLMERKRRIATENIYNACVINSKSEWTHF